MFFIHIALGTVITALVLNNLSTFTLILVVIIYWFFLYFHQILFFHISLGTVCTQVVEDKSSDNSAIIATHMSVNVLRLLRTRAVITVL
jgi:hypothetical protein